MTSTSWLAYFAVVLASTLSPGPAVLLAISNAVSFGPRAVLLSTLGNVTGLLGLASASIAGASAILLSSPLLFSILKGVGALYLIYLGVRQIVAGQRQSKSLVTDARAQAPRLGRLYVQGAVVALTNPKALLFFGALFPQFLTADTPLPAQVVPLIATLLACSFTALLGYGLLARRVVHWLDAGGARRFQRLSGAVFVSLGLALLRLPGRSP